MFDHMAAGSAETLKKALLHPDSYCEIDLPGYFDFQPILQQCSAWCESSEPTDLLREPAAAKSIQSSYFINTLKSAQGKKPVFRPLAMIHPLHYVQLVQQLTTPELHARLHQHVQELTALPAIHSYSMPVLPNPRYPRRKGQILNWWEGLEQGSLEQALRFSWMIATDITQCYPSLRPKTLLRALYDTHHPRDPEAQRLKTTLRQMAHPKGRGLPQSSAVAHLLAELVLGRIDQQLSQALERLQLSEYRILRYRDDYRIFAHSKAQVQEIAHQLSQVLQDWGLRLNPAKHLLSNDLIVDALKPEKRDRIGRVIEHHNPQKYLLNLYYYGLEHLNNGQQIRILQDFGQTLRQQPEFFRQARHDMVVLLAILTRLMRQHPRTIPQALAIVGILLEPESPADRQICCTVIRQQFQPLEHFPLLQVWLQRLTLDLPELDYPERLCRHVADPAQPVWDSGWLLPPVQQALDALPIINRARLEACAPVIERTEIDCFCPR